jgi:hypothetical protein
MLSGDDWKVAIDDARTRHAALTNLIFFTDTQASGLLRLYLTIGAAAASGAVAGLTKSAPLPFATSWALIGLAAALLLGSWFCFRATETSVLSLPGRGAEFWTWAAREDVPRELVLKSYLDNLVPEIQINRKLNAVTAVALSHAKLCGMIAPGVALVAGGAALLVVM